VENPFQAMLVGNVQFPTTPLYEKFKQICPVVTPVGKLLKADEYRKISQLYSAIDLKWFNAK
jgi:hypothetical protein